MKFINESTKVVNKDEIKELDSLQKELEKENVQLGNAGTKQPNQPKRSESWVDGITTTLVNLRKDPDVKSKSLEQIRGGEIVKINASINLAGFKQVKYVGKEGYIKGEYVKIL